tara:strand:+ start:241 stop:438 length:198 start_codon:yes stop_codon:yes gene_type:complete
MPVLEFDMLEGKWTEGKEQREEGCGCAQAHCEDGVWTSPQICDMHREQFLTQYALRLQLQPVSEK